MGGLCHFLSLNRTSGGEFIRICVKCSGYIAAGLGFRETVMDLPEGSTAADLLLALGPPVSHSWIAVIINGKIKDKRSLLKEDDHVLVLPIGGGG
jgi:sulfur carrier protein ThiS